MGDQCGAPRALGAGPVVVRGWPVVGSGPQTLSPSYTIYKHSEVWCSSALARVCNSGVSKMLLFDVTLDIASPHPLQYVMTNHTSSDKLMDTIGSVSLPRRVRSPYAWRDKEPDSIALVHPCTLLCTHQARQLLPDC